ncbi:hypothetical protein BJ508DRAFT_323715 [Ascobolus immersus RN42]|uniref:F-box domain-containing protein n=1 Tax=Ascobolus immersus RN42 TaxID=1160509 RepID=A0A3N4IJU8_ASCIM|nr:hypothetical protein BJ508DRAFT_323715 [Ascobolus immersus RN42]
MSQQTPSGKCLRSAQLPHSRIPTDQHLSPTTEAPHLPLFALPPELRLEIYTHCSAFTLLHLSHTSPILRREINSYPAIIARSFGYEPSASKFLSSHHITKISTLEALQYYRGRWRCTTAIAPGFCRDCHGLIRKIICHRARLLRSWEAWHARDRNSFVCNARRCSARLSAQVEYPVRYGRDRTGRYRWLYVNDVFALLAEADAGSRGGCNTPDGLAVAEGVGRK